MFMICSPYLLFENFGRLIKAVNTVKIFVVPETKLPLAVVLAVAALVLSPIPEAEARHCGHGYIKRVSLGICVGARSRAARGSVHRASGRHHFGRRYRRETLPREVEVEVRERVERTKKSARLPVPAPSEAPSVADELPLDIPGSLLMRPSAHRLFDWLAPN